MNTLTNENPQRLLLLDVMRAVAVFMMIQGHTIDALLSRSFYDYDSFLFQIWQTGRGLTAPIFLFGSGFAYVIANTRKSVNGRLPLSLVWRRLRWIALLFFIGACMHFPLSSIGNLSEVSPERWQIFYHVDVLRLIAVSLLGLLVVFLLARNIKQIFLLTIGLGIGVMLISPVLDSSAFILRLPEWLSGYLTFNSGSYFPVFPFGAYLYAGAASAALYKMSTQGNLTDTLIKRFAIYGGATLIAVLLLKNYAFNNAGWFFSSSSPFFVLYRLSFVMLMWVAVGLFVRKTKRLPTIIPVIGQHTLFIYVFHVAALYGSTIVLGLRHIYGKELTFFPVFIVIATLIVVCTGTAYVLHNLKNYNLQAYRLAPYAGAAILLFAIIF